MAVDDEVHRGELYRRHVGWSVGSTAVADVDDADALDAARGVSSLAGSALRADRRLPITRGTVRLALRCGPLLTLRDTHDVYRAAIGIKF
jgi:hypothetical protein